jgi:hypothetical protein
MFILYNFFCTFVVVKIKKKEPSEPGIQRGKGLDYGNILIEQDNYRFIPYLFE